MDQTTRRLRRRAEGRKSQGQRRRQGDRSAGANRHARRSDAGGHDLCRRDHSARPDAAPASALHHAAKFLPRFWRPRPRARHRARRKACRTKTPGGAARRRRRLSLQPGDPGARRLQAARFADPDRDLQQQGLHGDAEGPRASLSRRRRRERPHASRLAPQRLRLRRARRAFRPARRARRCAGQAQGRAANRIEESAGRDHGHPQCDGQ